MRVLTVSAELGAFGAELGRLPTKHMQFFFSFFGGGSTGLGGEVSQLWRDENQLQPIIAKHALIWRLRHVGRNSPVKICVADFSLKSVPVTMLPALKRQPGPTQNSPATTTKVERFAEQPPQTDARCQRRRELAPCLRGLPAAPASCARASSPSPSDLPPSTPCVCACRSEIRVF